MSAYIRSLEKLMPDPDRAPPVPPLEVRFLAWFNSLPEFTRNRLWSIQEIAAALGTQPRFLSRLLVAQNWVRKRKWDSRQHYHRYWVPPGVALGSAPHFRRETAPI